MWKKRLISAAVAGVLLSSAAFAALSTEIGVIKTLDTSKHQIVLDTGKAFEAPTVDLSTFKTGEKVDVSYELKDGKMVASKVKMVK